MKLPSPEEMREHMREIEKDAKDRLRLKGKYAPLTGSCTLLHPNTMTGSPWMCGGKIIADIECHFDERLGGPERQSFVAGYHCEECGVMYKFLPKEK